jgi:flagellar basal-body rod protein FlgC
MGSSLGGLFSPLDVSASALTAQRMRMDLIAGNIANSNTPNIPGQTPFQRKLAVFQTTSTPGDPAGNGVQVVQIASDPTAPTLTYDPSNPLANAQGYVSYPTISATQEMVDLTEASRAYEASATVMQSTKAMAQRTIDLLR